MKYKSENKPMENILKKMSDHFKEWLEIIIFPESTILDEPVEKWPLCHCLIAFHASGFPIEKACAYAKLRNPYVINDVERQSDLLDRVKVYKTLDKACIDHPKCEVLIRDNDNNQFGTLVEEKDQIEVNGVVFFKPFVEKPVSAEDHKIVIYYPSSAGGGSQRLFRKTKDLSSKYSANSQIRKHGSYIYEEFIPADGIDVKVYAVGTQYAHAEARKSPALDGKVERDSQSKEIRYPVILNTQEKVISQKIVNAFGQVVCGFDILRGVDGKSYVCDVNGFSFVKSSFKYCDDTAKILGSMILRKMAPKLNISWQPVFQFDDPPIMTTSEGKEMELRCVLAITRHGDRTPKQKTKIETNDKRFLAIYNKYNVHVEKKELKMKKPQQLQEVLKLARRILCEEQRNNENLCQQLNDMHDPLYEYDLSNKPKTIEQTEEDLKKCEEIVKKWEQVRAVLEMHGHFSGINRKVQLKYQSRRNFDSDCITTEEPSLLLVIKWGGELTTSGIIEAQVRAKSFRRLYGRRRSGQNDDEGLGFLRLHSTYRNDLKIYASDEGRVQMTAAAFAKGMLSLENELPPILYQMVKSADTDGLLDDDYNVRQYKVKMIKELHRILEIDRYLTDEDKEMLNPLSIKSVQEALNFVKNPRHTCEEIYKYVQKLCFTIAETRLIEPDKELYQRETWDLCERRWEKILCDFKGQRNNGDTYFDISSISNLFDNIKYDKEHNPDILNEAFDRLYLCAKYMAYIIVPQEYGITKEDKLTIGQRICAPLIRKLLNDLERCVDKTEENAIRLDPRASEGISTPQRCVRTRLYFTSESHLHALMNCIQYGDFGSAQNVKLEGLQLLSFIPEYDYLSQLVLVLFEETDQKPRNDSTFRVELRFTPGPYIKTKYGLILSAPFMSALRIVCEREDYKQSCKCDQFKSIDIISRIQARTLVLHGTEDLIVPFSHGITLFSKCKNPVEPLFLPGAGHDTELYEQFWTRIFAFLNELSASDKSTATKATM